MSRLDSLHNANILTKAIIMLLLSSNLQVPVGTASAAGGAVVGAAWGPGWCSMFSIQTVLTKVQWWRIYGSHPGRSAQQHLKLGGCDPAHPIQGRQTTITPRNIPAGHAQIISTKPHTYHTAEPNLYTEAEHQQDARPTAL